MSYFYSRISCSSRIKDSSAINNDITIMATLLAVTLGIKISTTAITEYVHIVSKVTNITFLEGGVINPNECNVFGRAPATVSNGKLIIAEIMKYKIMLDIDLYSKPNNFIIAPLKIAKIESIIANISITSENKITELSLLVCFFSI